MERVGKENKYICVESYRNEEEKQSYILTITCESFVHKSGYGGSKIRNILVTTHLYILNKA